MENITKIHAPDIFALLKLLFPKGYDDIIKARQISMLDNKVTLCTAHPEIKILGGKVTVLVEFTPEDS
jgi:hypothetical protein